MVVGVKLINVWYMLFSVLKFEIVCAQFEFDAKTHSERFEYGLANKIIAQVCGYIFQIICID